MAKWGNALGGWRKQKRNRKGQFGSGYAKSKAAVSKNRKAGPKSGTRSKERSRRQKYVNESYSKKGGYYRRQRDQLLSQGAFSNTKSGKARSRSGRSRNVAAFGGKVLVANALSGGAVHGAATAVSYARHRQYVNKQGGYKNEFALSSKKKPLTASQKKSRNRKIAAAAAVGVVGAAAYVGYQRHQDKKFDALPGITLYHNSSRNVARGGFKVSERIDRSYGADYVFFSNTKGGRARVFGAKQYKVKYNGPLTPQGDLAKATTGKSLSQAYDAVPKKSARGRKGLGVMRDYADQKNHIGGNLSRRGEQFLMISQGDLAGNVVVKRARSFDRKKPRVNHNNFATPAQKDFSKTRFAGRRVLGGVQQTPEQAIEERGVFNFYREMNGAKNSQRRLKIAKKKEDLKHSRRAARVAKARNKNGVVI